MNYRTTRSKTSKQKRTQTPAGFVLAAAKKYGFAGKGPKDLALNLDKYLYGQKI